MPLTATNPSPSGPPRERLAAAIAHASHLLPAQGPITVFIHHNTLHAFEHLAFDEALVRGSEALGCQPYLSEARFRAELVKGRIAGEDLRFVLNEEYGEAGGSDWRMVMLETPLWEGPTPELEYALSESRAFSRFRADVAPAARQRMIADIRRWALRDPRAELVTRTRESIRMFELGRMETWSEETWEAFALRVLWRVCDRGAATVPPPPPRMARSIRPRDAIVASGGEDPDLAVNEFLARFTAAFMDQGLSSWPLPERDLGFYRCFLDLYSVGASPGPGFAGLRAELKRLRSAGRSAEDSALESLVELGVAEAQWGEYLSATLLALRGWGGIVHHVEQRGDRVPHKVPAGSLVEFVAVRLILDRIAAVHFGAGIESQARPEPAPEPESVRIRRTAQLFQLAQLLEWDPAKLAARTPDEWAQTVSDIESFDSIRRRRVFHLAYERRFRLRTLDALAAHRRRETPGGYRASFQVVTCIDEREESFRRHLEEVAPECETFGAPGFFGVVMYHRGVTEAHYTPLCPIVVVPKHWVEERVPQAEETDHARRVRARRTLGRAALGFAIGSRSILAGTALSLLGALASLPLVAQVLFPRQAARWRQRLGEMVADRPKKTRLALERRLPAPAPSGDGVGYAPAEMLDIAERLLRDLGLVVGFAPLVLIVGHGSHSMNNPHESAHDCGACGGAVGGPNGRAAAQMLNDPRVRAGLAARGIAIPADTVFLGGLHNTCIEFVEFPDADLAPASHAGILAQALAAIEETLRRGSHERARRFDTAPLDIGNAAARNHMAARAEDLAQVRPEWGHATNAICVVGRRNRTRGLFLDRRAFLNSYDPSRDDADGTILGRILSAAVPVCGGISLEYYFSHVDNTGYGCGTKLPHNITGLIGVMDGAASDLRTGLPWQMVEIHEAMRLLFAVETTPEILGRVMDRIPVVGGMIRNGWVQMSVLDPDGTGIHVFEKGRFVPYSPTADRLPVAPTSADWYRGWRDHLDFAVIAPDEAPH